MAEGQLGPDFSTSYWKEFKLKYPRPAVYIPVGVAYLASVSAIGLSVGDWDEWVRAMVLLMSAVIAVASSAVAARSFASRRWLLKVRQVALLAGSDQVNADRVPSILGLLWQTCVPCGLGSLLLVPLYIGAGTLNLGYDLWSGGAIGLCWWAACAAGLAAASACGALVGPLAPPRFATRFGVLVGLLFVALRALGLFLVHGYIEVSHPNYTESFWWMSIASADIVLAVAVFGVAVVAASRALLFRVRRVGADYTSEAEVMADAPEGLGLGISFWALFRWKFWRDPICRAERRHLWSLRRILVMWAVAVLWAAGVWSVCVALRVDCDRQVFCQALLAMVVLPVLVSAGMMVVGLANDRQNGVLETLLLTPLAPLRTVAARLIGRCRPLCVAALILLAIASLASAYKLDAGLLESRYGFYRDLGWLRMGHAWYWPLVFLTMANVGMGVLACGAVGLRFAARCRTLMGALSLTFLFLIVFFLVSEAGLRFLVTDIFRWRATELGLALGGLLRIVLYGFLIRIFLVGAAQQLVLRRGE